MLQKLYVKYYILIDEVDLSFDNGFSVFTGETGAGKSIFIDCVSILIGESLTVTREISTDGKSSTRVNGKNASVSFVRSLLEDHIDIHSQRDNQYLLNDRYHLDLLDRFSGIQNELEELNCLFCYCPLYHLKDCPGNPVFKEKNGRTIKVCINCTFPHKAENYDEVIMRLRGREEK